MAAPDQAARQAPARAGRRASALPHAPAQEPAPPARRGRRASAAPVTKELAAEPTAPVLAPGRSTRRRASVAAATPAAATATAGAAPETAASARGGRRARASPARALALPPAVWPPPLTCAPHCLPRPCAALRSDTGPSMCTFSPLATANKYVLHSPRRGRRLALHHVPGRRGGR